MAFLIVLLVLAGLAYCGGMAIAVLIAVFGRRRR